MFTIKQVIKDPSNPKDNVVRLWAGTNVEYGYNQEAMRPHVSFDMPDGVHCSIDTGIVYVMNENGKTVDTYRLEGAEVF